MRRHGSSCNSRTMESSGLAKQDIFQEISGGFSHSGKSLKVFGCVPSAQAFVLSASLAQGVPNVTLVVAHATSVARKFYEDLQFFTSANPSFRVLFYPSDDLSPYVPSSPNISITAQRLECLYTMATSSDRPQERLVVVAPINALIEKVMDKQSLVKAALRVSVGDELERELLIDHLSNVGYVRSELVEDKGQFAVRGGIVDIFSPLYPKPLRFELFGDELESIRAFNPDTQRTLREVEGSKIKEVLILPTREIFFDDKTRSAAQVAFKSRMDDAGILKTERERFTQLIQNQVYFPGIEHYLPLFREQLVFPTSYVSSAAPLHVLLDAPRIFDEFSKFHKKIFHDFEESKKENHPTSVVLPEEKFVVAKGLVDFFKTYPWLDANSTWQRFSFESLEVATPHAADEAQMRILSKDHEDLHRAMSLARSGVGNPFKPLFDVLTEYRERGYKTVLVCGRKTQAKRLIAALNQVEHAVQYFEEPTEFFRDHLYANLKKNVPETFLVHGELSSGFVLPGQALAVIGEEEIFGPRIRRHYAKEDEQEKKASQKSRYQSSMISAFSELVAGDFVVHLDFGIGRYLGLEHLDLNGIKNDFLTLEYKAGDKLYLPIHRLSRIQKYVGGEAESVTLDRLGNRANWEKTQERVKKEIQQVAQELVALYATRQIAKGHAFNAPDDLYRKFEGEFPYEETPDQLASIDEVVSDLCSAKSMDRLICGDVGFGKTEVAIRGIFLVAMSGYQTALLAPTTVLVHQHYQNLKKRFAGYPITVGMLSRFATQKEIDETIQNMAEGKVDVVVGTHRLLSEDAKFKKLGLLVIDEEQRFGVRHKEKIKLFKKTVDVLTLSATPIPRTLNMSMIGVRDLSVINTPPTDRVSIRTMVSEFDDRVIREAILREINRGGQVYFVHNRVQSILEMASYLRKLVPEARIGIGHGQMTEIELEKVMVQFVNHEFDVLLCTTIIESGLDISLVNTIIINRADTFGLSQLYQLRGRVGRSDRRAYAFLLVPGQYLISENARKRLEVLQRFTELGSGFRIASYDLEIRGAGNLLGSSQSGHIKNVGLELYVSLMSKAIQELKGEKVDQDLDPEIDLRIPAFIPEDFIPEENLRLGTYKRLSMLTGEEEVEEIEMELKDRFGALPREVKNLLKVIDIKVLAKKACVTKLVFGGASATFQFDDRTPVDVHRLLYLVNTHKGWRILPDNRLVVPFVEAKGSVIPLDREDRLLKAIRSVLEKLLPKPN